jgi:PAS domain S-box-containing protein
MNASSPQSSDEIKRLQRCISDLVSVLALPAIWQGNEPSQIVETLMTSLLSILDLDLIYVRLRDPDREGSVEVVKTAVNWGVEELQPREVGDLLERSRSSSPRESPSVRARFGDRDLCIFPIRLGLQGEIGLLAAGSQRTDFPQQTEMLLLTVAANQAHIGLQEARLLSEQIRLTEDLDRRVAQRTAELAQANEELKNEIAERKKIEDRLLQSEGEIKRSESKLRQAIDTIPTLAWCNLPDGPNEFLNKGWHEYTGLSPEESHGWGWQVAFHPNDVPAVMQKWGELLISGKPDEMEARLRRHDGVYRWFLIRVEPLRDETGQIVRWYGTSTDIDDRKQAEEQLRRSQAFLSEGQHLARIGNFSWVVAPEEIRWSEQLYRIFEFETDSPVTLERIATRVHPEDTPMLYDMVERARAGVSNFEYEHRLLMPDHSVKYLHLIAHGSGNEQGRQEYIGAVQDVTQRRNSEDALAKARSELAQVARINSLAMLTASIAHEVNQPLAGIVTNASTSLRMLGTDPPNVDGARETARRTIRDGNRAAEVITRLRTLFTKKEVAAESVDLNDATKEVIALSLSDLQRARVLLRTELAEALPRVSGDRVQLQQVILNLLRNACEAMSSTGVRPKELLIRTHLHDNQVQLAVKDAGVGVNPEAVDKLFEAFYTTKSDGMGIGLSISRSIIEAHHGRMWAAPNDGPGATFAFSIPCESA